MERARHRWLEYVAEEGTEALMRKFDPDRFYDTFGGAYKDEDFEANVQTNIDQFNNWKVRESYYGDSS